MAFLSSCSNFAICMDLWYNSVSIFELLLKGMAIGVLASCLMGPIGILCIQRTLNKGRWYGFATGIGATVSDFFYAVITGFGMSFVAPLIEDAENMKWMKIIGAVTLFVFGIISYFSNPTKNKKERARNGKGTYWYNGWTSFLVTLSNPAIILLFTAAFAMFAFVVPEHPFEVCVGFLGIIIGALLWWFAFTFAIDKLRDRFSDHTIILINRVMGIIVVLLSLYILIGTCTDFYSLPDTSLPAHNILDA